MKKMIVAAVLLCLLQMFVYAQKRVINYPVNYSKGFLEKKEYESFFLQDPATGTFTLILKDNKQVDYVLFDSKFKVINKIHPEDGFKSTVFNEDDAEYLGGVAKDNVFRFVYKVTDKKLLGSSTYYKTETVDFSAKTVTYKDLFEIGKKEDLLISFGEFGQYFSMTTDESNQLKLYGLNTNGESFTKTVNINIPSTAKEKKLSGYLKDIALIAADEDPGIELAKEKVKLFNTPANINILVNEADDPTQVFTINKNDFTVKQTTIDHSALTKEEKGRSYINSFLFGDKIFSLILNTKNIRLVIYDMNGSLVKLHEINENTDLYTFAASPVSYQRTGKTVTEKELGELKKVIKALDKGSEGIAISMDKKGRLIITVGTYDPVKISSGSGVGSYGIRHTNVSLGSASTQTGPNTFETKYYRPGVTSYVKQGANYYKSVFFKLMIDPATNNIVKGLAPPSVSDQVKDYLADVDKKAQARNQFQFNGKEYYAYYLPEDKSYVVEEIFIRK